MAPVECVVFLGPTLAKSEVPKTFVVRPPAAAGDVLKALRLRPRALVLIDGVFEASPSVWHKELLKALDAGVAVFGASSMGALRAAELFPFGMVGIGHIFEWYRTGQINDDAEVALLHADKEHGFRSLTVPLVNIRHNARLAREARVLSSKEATQLVDVASCIFYQERTWGHLEVALAKVWGPDALRKWAHLPKEDLKALDAKACLEVADAWLKSGAQGPMPRWAPQTSTLRRMGLEKAPDNEEQALSGTRKLMLASWARSLGLSVTTAELEEAHGHLGDVVAAAGGGRTAEDWALERKLLRHSFRILNDGPSLLEGASFEALTAKGPRKRQKLGNG